MEFLLGSDPEVFVTQAGKFLSAFGLIPGTKEEPHPVDNGAVQVDGMALEFNINPSTNESEFLFNIESVLSQMKAMVPDYEVVAAPVADFDEFYLQMQPEEALELGCGADYNAWQQGERNPKPDASVNFRTGAGHVHIGWGEGMGEDDPRHMEYCCRIARQLDFFLGLPSLLFDDDTRRRELYGCAGAFRPKSYGLEYRVLSNKWLDSPDLIKWVYRAVDAALQSFEQGNLLEERWGDIAHIINNSDVEAAKAIIEQEGLEVPE